MELPEEKQSLTFDANKDKACFNVTLLDDQLKEGVLDFSAIVKSVPSEIDIGIPDKAIISIGDDESKKLHLIVRLSKSVHANNQHEGKILDVLLYSYSTVYSFTPHFLQLLR